MAFIVFEGLDGSGKSSLIGSIDRELQAQGRVTQLTREPGGTPLGEELRTLLTRTHGQVPVPRAELLLYEAIRAQHVDCKIRPALSRNEWVLCDRYTPASLAFQSAGRGIAENDIGWLNNFATTGLSPHLIVLLDLPVEESLKRRESRKAKTGVDHDRFERETQEFHERVRQNYLAQAKASPAIWLVLDAKKNPDELLKTVLKELGKWLS